MKQLDAKVLLEGQVYNQKVADDFLAAFLHAGIPVNKMSHASIQGLFAKYTKVSGCLPKKSGAYQACSRVREAHLACIRKKLENKKVFVSTDEWTSDQGFAILNILIASEGIWTKLSALDPRNVQTRGSPKLDHNPGLLRPPLVQTLQTKTWSHYKNWFAPEYLPGEDEARTIEKRKLEAHLKTEWERYMQVCLWT